MPRIGLNPMLGATVKPLPSKLAAVITYLPNRNGYFANRFSVIEFCLNSLRRTADLPLYIWDNGSDDEFRDWLLNVVKPDFLTMTRNVGKASARTAILRSFPPSTIICFSDDDVLFLDGWLPAHLELLEGFPNVGVVSGCPIRTNFKWGIDSTLKWARENATLRVGRFIPDKWEYDFCASIGRDFLTHMAKTADLVDYVIEYNGLQAYATAHHMQFVCYAGRLAEIGLWPEKAMRAEHTLDIAIDRLELLRLTTINRYTIHMGNVLDKEIMS